MNRVRDAGKRAMGERKPLEGPLTAQMLFVFLAPASWSEKRRSAAKWVASKPDIDNLVKAIADSLGRYVEKLGSIEVMDDCVYIDDAQICEITAQKVYGIREEVIVTISELEGKL
jgi:Holliday junction resolvase RusA-like endonuclease